MENLRVAHWVNGKKKKKKALNFYIPHFLIILSNNIDIPKHAWMPQNNKNLKWNTFGEILQ